MRSSLTALLVQGGVNHKVEVPAPDLGRIWVARAEQLVVRGELVGQEPHSLSRTTHRHVDRGQADALAVPLAGDGDDASISTAQGDRKVGEMRAS